MQETTWRPPNDKNNGHGRRVSAGPSAVTDPGIFPVFPPLLLITIVKFTRICILKVSYILFKISPINKYKMQIKSKYRTTDYTENETAIQLQLQCLPEFEDSGLISDC